MTSPLGWRDLQAAIADAKEEMLAAIHAMELRIEKRMDEQDRIAGETTKQVSFFVDREKGIRMVLGGTAAAVALIGGVLAIARLIGVI